jgi:3'-5' exoribonuclease
MRLVVRLADHYPQADRDLLVAGAFLQGVMRAREVGTEKGTPFTDEGRLVGAAVMAAQLLREKVRTLPDFPALLEQHLTHIVLAAHETRPALTLEAELVRSAVALDTRLSGWLEAMGRDTHETWTEPLKADGRPLWKGPLPTQRGRGPVEGRRRKEKKPRGEKAAAAPQGEGRPEGRKEEAPSAPSTPRPPRPARELPGELSFKPFSALMAMTSEQQGEKPAGGEGTPSGGESQPE